MYQPAFKLLLILLFFILMGCENNEVETLSVSDDEIEEELPDEKTNDNKEPDDLTSFERSSLNRRTCVLSNIDEGEFYEPFADGVKLRLTDAIYLMPMSNEHEIGVRVVEVLNNRVIKVKGDLTSYQSGRFENVYQLDKNPFVYFLYRGFNQDYEMFIEPLTGTNGNWPYFDGENTWIYVENRDHAIEEGDFLNFFLPPSNQFPSVYLPEVTPEVIEKQDTLSIQVLLTSGENIQVRRNEDNGLGRIQFMNSNKTDEANIALLARSGESLYSLTLVPKEFSPQAGYSNYGWQLIETNVNYYPDCLFGVVFGEYSDGIEKIVYELFIYEPDIFNEDEEEDNDFENALERVILDDNYFYSVQLFPGTYECYLYQYRRERLDFRIDEKTVVVSPGSLTEINF